MPESPIPAYLPASAYRVQGTELSAKALDEIADEFKKLANIWRNADSLGSNVTTTGGISFRELMDSETSARTIAIVSDLAIITSAAPPFSWKEGDELNPLHLRIDSFGDRGGGFNGPQVGIRVIHLPTMIEVTERGQRSQHANRAAALREVVKRLKEQSGVKNELV